MRKDFISEETTVKIMTWIFYVLVLAGAVLFLYQYLGEKKFDELVESIEDLSFFKKACYQLEFCQSYTGRDADCERSLESNHCLSTQQKSFDSQLKSYGESNADNFNALISYTAASDIINSINFSDGPLNVEAKETTTTGQIISILKKVYPRRIVSYPRNVKAENGLYSRLIQRHLAVTNPRVAVNDLLDIYDPKNHMVDIVFNHKGKNYHWDFKQTERRIPTDFYDLLIPFIAASTDGAVLAMPSAKADQLSTIYLNKDLINMLLHYEILKAVN